MKWEYYKLLFVYIYKLFYTDLFFFHFRGVVHCANEGCKSDNFRGSIMQIDGELESLQLMIRKVIK